MYMYTLNILLGTDIHGFMQYTGGAKQNLVALTRAQRKHMTAAAAATEIENSVTTEEPHTSSEREEEPRGKDRVELTATLPELEDTPSDIDLPQVSLK